MSGCYGYGEGRGRRPAPGKAGKMKILVIEDDQPIAAIIRLGLEGARYTVETAEDGETGLRMAQEGRYSLIILDLMLPRMDGWSLCRALRDRKIGTPILMLTARDGVDERVRGLELGADDYLAKPFHFAELLARVQALTRRDQVHKGRMIRIGDLEIDTTLARVRRAGQEVTLSRREYALLEALAANEGKVLSWSSLADRAIEDGEPGDNVDGVVEMLRWKIDEGREPELITPIGSIGYVLQGPETPGR